MERRRSVYGTIIPLLGVTCAIVMAASALDAQQNKTIDPLTLTSSLKTVAVPTPANLGAYLQDQSALVALGKAFFWDQQAGSDGQACGSCHFHAGADSRSKNQLNPGFKNTTPGANSNVFGDPAAPSAFGPNYQLKQSDFPFHNLSDPDDRHSAVLSDTNDVVSSQGVLNAAFTGLAGGATDTGTPSAAGNGAVFNVGGTLVRNVEPRNTPTVFNAVFNHRNFWDGRARNEFNGVNPFGDLDPTARLVRAVNPGQDPTIVSILSGGLRLTNSSLASQAVGPPGNNLEMSFDGRTLPFVGRKLLGIQPLGLQVVATDDSVLGPFSSYPSNGVTFTYSQKIMAAFKPEWWSSDRVVQVNPNGSLTITPAGTPLDATHFTQMESNFSLFWGLAVQAYEATLLANDSRFDRFMEYLIQASGKPLPPGAHPDQTALNEQEIQGLQVFLGKGRCIKCHGGAELSLASVASIERTGLTRKIEVGEATQRTSDNGFSNTSVRQTSEDLGVGGLSPNGSPLSICREQGLSNTKIVVDGTVKIPQLRNLELTAPYFHNGGTLTISQTVEFYDRGGDFADQNVKNLDNNIRVLDFTDDEDEALAAFLFALTDERVRFERAPFDHPSISVPNGGSGIITFLFGFPIMDDRFTIPAVGASGVAVPTPNFADLLPP